MAPQKMDVSAAAPAMSTQTVCQQVRVRVKGLGLGFGVGGRLQHCQQHAQLPSHNESSPSPEHILPTHMSAHCVHAGSTNDAYSPAWFAPQASSPSQAADELERAVLASVDGSSVLQQVTLASGAEYRAFSAPRCVFRVCGVCVECVEQTPCVCMCLCWREGGRERGVSHNVLCCQTPCRVSSCC